MLGRQAKAIRDRVETRERHMARAKRELKEREATAQRLREEIQATNRMLRSYDEVLRTCVPHFPVPDELRQEILGAEVDADEEEHGQEYGREEGARDPGESIDIDNAMGQRFPSQAAQASFASSLAVEEPLTSFLQPETSGGMQVAEEPAAGPGRAHGVDSVGSGVGGSLLPASPMSPVASKDAIMAFVASDGGSEDDGDPRRGEAVQGPTLGLGAAPTEEHLVVEDL